MTTNDKIEFLKQRFLENVYVKDAEKGYLVVSEFNLTIDPDILQFASSCWADKFHAHTDIDAIVGLPDAGARLVSILAQMLRVKHILPSKRTTQVPGSWKDVVSFSNSSFTTNQQEVVSHVGFVKPGMKILVVDDVIAHGNTAAAALSALQEAGAEIVGMAVLFDKAWQGGVARIQEETGIEPFSLVSIKKIQADGVVSI